MSNSRIPFFYRTWHKSSMIGSDYYVKIESNPFNTVYPVIYRWCPISGSILPKVIFRQSYVYMDLPICSPWTFRENHSPNIIYTVDRRNEPTAMDLYFLDWVRTRYKTEPETHTKSAHTVLWPSGRQLWIGTTRSAGVEVWVSVSDMGRVGSG